MSPHDRSKSDRLPPLPIAFITGASHGIGAAVAREFAAEPDARIALIARTKHKLNAIAEGCNSRGATTMVIPCDVTSPEAVADAARQVIDAWGPPDLLFNNAGQFVPGSIADTSPKDFRYQVEVNLNSAFYVTHAFLRSMKERGSGTIIFTASVASIKGYPGGAAYCAAKHGLLGLARATREETRGTGVRSSALILGATYTPSWEAAALPEDRFIPVEDVAFVVMDIYRKTDRTVVEEILIRPADGDI